MIISTIAVVLFMLVYYRFAGMVADIAVLMNMVLATALMIMIKAAFTLPGLAGFVLTVGMAVDANVLIYERIREETAPRGLAADGHPQRLCPGHGHDHRLALDHRLHGRGALHDRHRPDQGFCRLLDPGPGRQLVHRGLRGPGDLRHRRAQALDHQAEHDAVRRRDAHRLRPLARAGHRRVDRS